ncbi:hypothetical protein [uncultured Photobacterium sp.]|uniref:hypothetical protein n=1 Tax=uncultured Photobacterium sp. TaxID=173973 RepID=UPI0026017F28|nr:hypothetical protein [uncultured Photobacterium sp.]
MNWIKQGLFIIFFNFQPFFNLAFPMMFGLCLLGASMGLLLKIPPSNVQEYSDLISLGFIVLAGYLATIKHYYPLILAFADTRRNQIVIPLHTKRGIK